MRSRRLVAAIFLLVSLAVGPAWAQSLTPSLSIDAEAASVLVDEGAQKTVAWTVRNTGSTDGTVRVGLAQVNGWDVGPLDSSSFALAAGAQRRVEVKVTSRAAGPDAQLVLAGVLTDAVGRQSSEVRAPVRLSVVAAPVPEVVPEPAPRPYAQIALGALGAMFLGLYAFQASAVRMEVSSDKLEVTPAGSGYVRVTVRNRFWPARTIGLRVRDMPSPAVAALSFEQIRLRRGESACLPVLVKAPVEMPDGAQVMTLQARAGRFSPWIAKKRIALQFRNPLPASPLVVEAPFVAPPDAAA